MKWSCIDGNEAAARVAYALSEVVAIYPITPASPMGEYADEWAAQAQPNQWGLVPEVVELSLPVDDGFRPRRPAGEVAAMFFGLGADGTVGANKSSVKIIGEHTDLFAQGYFVYDSKKSGSVTVSHLRFGPEPIRSTYLIEDADFVACHQFGLLERMKVLECARQGATFLLNSPYPATQVWDRLPGEVQEQIVAKGIDFWVVDAYRVAAETGMGNRINTVMQPCFFQLSGVLPPNDSITYIKASVEKAYGKRGRTVVESNVPVARGAVPGRGAGVGDGHPDPPRHCAPRRTRVRPARDGHHHGRRRRPAAGLRPARRRDVPDRHHPL